jgi:cation transport regulator ChaC
MAQHRNLREREVLALCSSMVKSASGNFYYFAYGSNMDPTQMTARVSDYQSISMGILQGYTMKFNKAQVRDASNGEGYSNLVKDPTGTVVGVIYDVTLYQILDLDRYEGVPDHYERVEMPICKMTDVEAHSVRNISTSESIGLFSGSTVTCTVYLANTRMVNSQIAPSMNYVRRLCSGWMLPIWYKERIRQIAVAQHDARKARQIKALQDAETLQLSDEASSPDNSNNNSMMSLNSGVMAYQPFAKRAAARSAQYDRPSSSSNADDLRDSGQDLDDVLTPRSNCEPHSMACSSDPIDSVGLSDDDDDDDDDGLDYANDK